MKEKKNEFWWLDILEVKFTKASPRFKFTKKLLNAHKNSHLLKRLPSTRNDAFAQIEALKSDLFAKKYHGAHKKLSREVARLFKQRGKADRTEHLETVFGEKTFVEQLVSARLAKLITNALLTTKELKENPPSYIPKEHVSVLTDLFNPCNPTAFYITHVQNDKIVSGYVSKLWNSKEMKALCGEVEWTFRKIRGNLTKEEIAKHSQADTLKRSNTKEELEIGSDSESDDNLGNDMSLFDQLVAGSNDDDDHGLSLDSSEDERELKQRKIEKKLDNSFTKEKKLERKLPQLATGYFSEGSDDEEDIDNNKVVKELTQLPKNRRGQRARQKIWEQKYGVKANHVQQEALRVASERERKQQEFEERQRKRELKAQQAGTTGDSGSSANANKLHPSWEAKKLAEQKQKGVKFMGKKITFD